jgi:L-aminopeptidase/D-esterase-like protein
MERWGITAVEGLELGHHTLTARPTGCTVVLARAGAVGGVDVRGSAPGTRETDLLDPVKSPNTLVNAIVLSGGSAFGLDAASGVMQWLVERDIGYRVGPQIVPIVPAAIIYDLGLETGERIRPGPECGYAAAGAASTDAPAEGSVGAGAGATVGKFGGPGSRSMRGGFGTASITLASGLTVAAAVVVNAVGDIVDPATGAVVAGALNEAGGFLDARRLLREGQSLGGTPGANTTIGIVATNAVLTKTEATKVAEMAQDGLVLVTDGNGDPFVPGHGADQFLAFDFQRRGDVGGELGKDLRRGADVDCLPAFVEHEDNRFVQHAAHNTT